MLGREVSQTRTNTALFALDFARIRGIDCTRCWPIKYVFDRAFASGSCESTRVVRSVASLFVLAQLAATRAAASFLFRRSKGTRLFCVIDLQ